MRRRRRAALVVAALVAGLALMVPFEGTLTRVLGLACLLAFVVGGVFVLADPAYLSGDETADHDRRGSRGARRRVDGDPGTRPGNRRA